MTADSSACPLTIRLFGSFEAEVHGAPLPHLRTRKGAWLLALLALQAGRPVERDWLALALWPESRHFRESLRQSLKDLRRALGPEAARLRAPTPRTLVLDLTGAAVDVLAFDAAVARGDPPSLEQAVALYQGPLLDGCPESWAFEARQFREQAFLEALERLAAAARAGADPVAAERYLRWAVAADPLRESTHRELMRVLAAGGNQGAALQVYRELRRRLRRELHAEPDPETRALFRVLRGSAGRPTPGLDLREQGAAEAGACSAGASELRGARHNLPHALNRFIGREAELEEGRRLMVTHRLVTLAGAGGSGKTRLALELALELCGDFADGAFLVSLASLTDPGLVPATVAATLGVREEGGQPITERLKAFLRCRQMLLVLDNFEHLIHAAPVVTELLGAAPQLKVLVTSREVLRVRGERDMEVLPLALPDRHSRPSLAELSRCEAVALFLDRAAAARPGFVLTEENAAVVAEICRRLDGLPLAIELAAARLRYFSPRRLLARLETRLTLLAGGARDLPARQRTLRDTIAWSYDLLDESEKALFRRMAVFAGGFTLDTAAAVCSESRIQNEKMLAGCASLAEKSLLQGRLTPHGEPRFAMLETIREYGLECLMVAGEAEAIRWRHAQCMLALAEEVRPKIHGPEQGEWLERLEGEHDNLRAALAWALKAADSGQWSVASADKDAGKGELVFDPPAARAPAGLTPDHCSLATSLRLAGALGEFWFEGGHWDEGRAWLERALAAAPAAEPTVERARALAAAGRLIIYPSFGRADYAAARSRLEESVALYRRLADPRGLVEALSYLSELLQRVRHFAVARQAEEEAVALARSLGDPRLLSLALGQLFLSLVDAWMHLGESFGLAWQIGEESLALARQVGDRGLMAAALQSQGRILQRQGDLAKARALLEESLQLARVAKSKRGLARSLFFLAALLTQQGNTERAKPLWEESFRLSGELGDLLANFALRALVAQAPSWEGALQIVAQAPADYGPDVVRDALRALVVRAPSDEEALQVIEQAVAEYGLEVARGTLEALVVRAPSSEEALQWIDWAAREYGPAAAIFPLGALGHAAQERGDYERAATCYRRSLALRQEVGDIPGLARSLENFAGLAARQQQWERAARLWGAAEGACVELKRTLPLPVPEGYKRAVEGARAALGEEAFAAAWAEGRAMTLDQAISYALERETLAFLHQRC